MFVYVSDLEPVPELKFAFRYRSLMVDTTRIAATSSPCRLCLRIVSDQIVSLAEDISILLVRLSAPVRFTTR